MKTTAKKTKTATKGKTTKTKKAETAQKDTSQKETASTNNTKEKADEIEQTVANKDIAATKKNDAKKEVKIEEFSFYPIPDKYYDPYDIEDSYYKDDHYYHIAIGQRKYEDDDLYDGDHNYEYIRNQLETLTFQLYSGQEKSEIKFSPGERAILKIEQDKHEDYVRLTYKDRYEDKPLTGYCMIKQFLKTFYEGLLSIALTHDNEKHEWIIDHDDIPLLAAYNMLKSPIIENYLKTLENPEKTPMEHCDVPYIRQRTIRTILQIEPGKDASISYLGEDKSPISIKNDLFEDFIDPQRGKPIRVIGYSAWQDEIKSANTDHFDWVDYHDRGLELAQNLRSKLPQDVDLWYAHPHKDTSGIIPRPFLVSGY